MNEQFTYDPDTDQMVNLSTGARTSPPNTMEVVDRPALKLRTAIETGQQYIDTVTHEIYAGYIAENPRTYHPLEAPGVPLAATVSRADGSIHITTPYTYPARASLKFSVRIVVGAVTTIIGAHLPTSLELLIDSDRFPDALDVYVDAENEAGLTPSVPAHLAAA